VTTKYASSYATQVQFFVLFNPVLLTLLSTYRSNVLQLFPFLLLGDVVRDNSRIFAVLVPTGRKIQLFPCLLSSDIYLQS
jgi:hypothetical protein